ncbi:MAG: HAD family hydrolase [Kiritimatiellia bacterium]|jgi:D-glycero-D-manno-heptose 1,7-bisphosphate phosphatase|nr:HAD family hydrolase [Kiritimatiellia bacterium]
MKKCVFLDRDGIVNRRVMDGYVESWEGFELLPEFPELLRKVSAMGYVAVIITNQRGVARGIMSREAVDAIHASLKVMLEHDFGLHLLDVMVCPHERDSCTCRKPQPRMILDAAEKHGIDLASSWMIGDTESDVEAGRRAGCRSILVSDEPVETVASVRLASMRELVWRIEELLVD